MEVEEEEVLRFPLPQTCCSCTVADACTTLFPKFPEQVRVTVNQFNCNYHGLVNTEVGLHIVSETNHAQTARNTADEKVISLVH